MAVLTDIGAADPRAAVAPQNDALTAGMYGDALRTGAGDGSRYSSTAEMIKGRMPDLVKGAGLAHKGGNMPLSNHSQIMTKAAQASMDIRLETARGFGAKSQVVNSLNQGWLNSFGALKTALTMPSLGEELAGVLSYMPGGSEALQKFAAAKAYGALESAGLGKSFTAGNLGIGSIYGLTPFNLLAPSRLIYPVYTVYRNKFSRPPGQGASVIERLVTGVSGSQTGGQGVLDVSIPEMVTQGGSFGSWPLNLPGPGSQTLVTLNIPFRFFGITEQLSWLAQFAGQGYEDISALANLIMLQEMMLGLV